MRPECISFAGNDRYSAIWYDDQIGEWHSFHGMTSDSYQRKFDEMRARGFMPIRVNAGGAGNDTRFAAVFARDDQKPARQWTVHGPSAAGLAAFDDVVRDFMEANGVRAGQLAVVRRGKLVYARAFTHAEPGYPITDLNTVFRVASVSKTVTATAAHALIEHGHLALEDRMQDILHLRTPSGGAPSDPNFAKIRVWHLLSHSSGFENNVDATPSPRTVADLFTPALALPITRQQYAQFGPTRPVANPGTHVQYNSYAYFLLGQVIAAKADMKYEDFVNTTIWVALGVSRAAVAPSLVGNALPHEAWYQPAKPGLGTSVMTADQPLVSVQYGTQYTEIGAAMGGWALAAADYARLWASFDIGAHNPVVSPQTVGTMWSTPAGIDRADALRGWWREDAGAGVTAIGHNGGLQGTAAAVWRRSDGVSVAVIFNRDINNLDFPNGALFGTPMNAAISAVTSWPTNDLFPHAGLTSICDDGWRRCSRCQVLFRVGGKSPASCPAGPGGHSETGSAHYTLVHDLPAARGQWGWRRCRQCESLWFADGGATGACTADPHGQHRAGEISYVLAHDQPATSPGQSDWHWCSRCQSLWRAGSGTSGACAGGPGGHVSAGSSNYLLLTF
jgi:CubicO group peptidase (beta-lactamase class C family)